jgi:hypothetical protein
MNAATALHEQIKRYRLMTGEQRLAIALDLHELSCEVAREGIRRQHPQADATEVERLLHRRLELARAAGTEAGERAAMLGAVTDEGLKL